MGSKTICHPPEADFTQAGARGHYCSLYESVSERLAAAAAFLRTGLAQAAQCVYLSGDGVAEQLCSALRQSQVDVDAALASRALLIVPAGEAGLRRDLFDSYRLYHFWRKSAQSARHAGFQSLWGASDMGWMPSATPGVQLWQELEHQLTQLASATGSIFLCQFDRARFPANFLLQVLRAHPSLVYQRKIYPNLFYVPPEGLAGSGETEQQLQRRIKSIVEDNRQQEEALRTTQGELTRASRLVMLGELTASLAHEVNQPLAAITTNANAALRWLSAKVPNKEEAVLALSRIVRDGYRASAVIERIRALASKTEATKERVDLNETITDVMTLVRAELRSRQILLKTEFDGALPLVLADRVSLQQVVLNLILNAMDALSVLPADRPREILARTQNDATTARVHVMIRDRGLGLAPEMLEKVFEPFYTTKSHGMGMGLSVCRGIIQSCGGRLWAESNQDGPGAAFHFVLPAWERAEAEGDVENSPE